MWNTKITARRALQIFAIMYRKSFQYSRYGIRVFIIHIQSNASPLWRSHILIISFKISVLISVLMCMIALGNVKCLFTLSAMEPGHLLSIASIASNIIQEVGPEGDNRAHSYVSLIKKCSTFRLRFFICNFQ